MRVPYIFTILLATASLQAHPMGNFSVSHYLGIEIGAGKSEARYVLDLAEIPTFELLRTWNLDRDSAKADLDRKAGEQAREWVRNLVFTSNGKPVRPVVESVELVIADGAGNLPILRITSRLRLAADAGRFEYEDRNFPDRAGWKEIVIRTGKGAHIDVASQQGEDRSKALTEYPADPTVAPPQDLRARIDWTAIEKTPVLITKQTPVVKPIPQPAGPPAVAPATMTTKSAPAGAVVRGDFLSRLLHQKELTFGMILIALVVAFGLGAAHALTPGHGKTIVAAYLVGSRGTMKHAAFLGALVTFTHTVSVFLLGLATLFLFQFIMPEKITQILGAISGLSIVVIGGWMVYRRVKNGVGSRESGVGKRESGVGSRESGAHGHDHHHHGHDHDHHHHDRDHHHGHGHDHDHHHDHGHGHDHHHHDHGHSHGPGGHHHHHHVPDKLSWGSLVALGISGGLVPCESALILLLGAIALHRVGLGLLLLVAFSLGLATVLMAIGALVLFAKHLLPKKKSRMSAAFRWVPVVSGAVVVCVGLIMTAVSLGWLGSKWMIS